jgi:hypothetical protein
MLSGITDSTSRHVEADGLGTGYGGVIVCSRLIRSWTVRKVSRLEHLSIKSLFGNHKKL